MNHKSPEDTEERKESVSQFLAGFYEPQRHRGHKGKSRKDKRENAIDL
jgi:hypothetical protein